jgi:hypothetical protein
LILLTFSPINFPNVNEPIIIFLVNLGLNLSIVLAPRAC